MTLVIMAAGMGNRYGGLKQIDPVGKNGEFIIDYSIYDAINAGFNKVVFIIKEENLQVFKETVGNRIASEVEVKYAFQKKENIPSHINAPLERTKPWGTAQAVLACADIVKENFAVINADDFYGKKSFQLVAEFLKEQKENNSQAHYCMAGYVLENTLTDNGHVARGVCETNCEGYLTKVTERIQIEKNNGVVQFYEEETGYTDLDSKSTVSMNFWGFSTDIFARIEERFDAFFEVNKQNLLKAEYLLPCVVDELIREDKCDVKVLNTDAKWYGVTYHDDKQRIVDYISNLIENGTYPERLWRNA